MVEVCCNYRFSSRSRLPEFEIEMDFDMTLIEIFGVDLAVVLDPELDK